MGATFGMPTLIETPTLETCVGLCRELGLEFIELNMNQPQYQTDRLDPDRLRAAAGESGLFFTVHLDGKLDVCDFNPRVAQAYRETVLEVIDTARAVGCPVLNMHLARGVHFTLPEGKVRLYETYGERYRRDLRRFRDQCEDRIGGAEVRICVENSDGYLDFQREGLDLLLESPAFALTYDIGHDRTAGGVDGPFLLARRERLVHMHVHDAREGRDHLALGDGELDVSGYLALAEERGCRVVLETKTVAGLRKSVEWVRRHR